jgi:Ser/Thr protein kinase RdoA (MazF antagonist)
VVRVHRPHVTRQRLGAIHRARTVLLAGGVPCASPVPTARGAPWVVLQGRRPRFANHLEPADVVASVRRGTAQIRGWGPTPGESRLAAVAEELAERVAETETRLVSRLPCQLVHGDFWDNNVLLRGGRPVLQADFDFMGERARIDDLALTLHCARCDLGGEGDPLGERARLRRLVAGYDAGLDVPLSAAERAALPVAIARQPLSSIGVWVARLDDPAAARRHAASAGSELEAARRMTTDLGGCQAVFA